MQMIVNGLQLYQKLSIPPCINSF